MDRLNQHFEQLGFSIRSLELAEGGLDDTGLLTNIKALSEAVKEFDSGQLTLADWVDGFRQANELFAGLLSRFETDKPGLGARDKVRLSGLYKEFEQLVTAVGVRLRQSVGEDFPERPLDKLTLNAMEQLNVPLTDRQLLSLLERSPELLDENCELILSLLPIEPIDPETMEALLGAAERMQPSGLVYRVLVSRIFKSAFLYTPVYRRYRLAYIEAECSALRKKIKTRKEQLRARFKLELAALEKEQADIQQGPESAAAVLELARHAVPQSKRSIFDASFQEVQIAFEQNFRHFQRDHQSGDVYLRITSYGFANLYAQLGGLPDFFTHTGIILREWQHGIPCYFIAEYTRSGFNVAPLSHIQKDKNVLVRPDFPLPGDFDHGSRILDNMERLGPHSFDLRMSDQLRDADNMVRMYCTEYVHYVFKHQFNLERCDHSPFDGIEAKLRLSGHAEHNATCIGQRTDQVYYVPDDFFHSPEVRYAGHGFPWAALPLELDQSAYRARIGRDFNQVMTANTRLYRFKPLALSDRLVASLFRMPSRSGATRRALELMSPENFGGKVFIPVENNRQGDYFIRFAGVAFSFEGAWKKACTLEDGSKNPRWREDFEAMYHNRILPNTHALFDIPAAEVDSKSAQPGGIGLTLKGLGGVALQMLLFAALLLIPAGTWQWPRALQFIAVFGMVIGTAVVWLARVNPAGLQARLEAHVSKRQVAGDRSASLVLAGGMTLYLIAIPLDIFWFQLLPPLPWIVSLLGLLLSLAGWLLFVATLSQNEFAVPVVREQQDRHQQLRDKGLYGLVRHPMYLGMLLGRFGLALWLGSTAVALAIPLLAACFLPRIRIEEQTLLSSLDGYSEYCSRVRHKIIPGVW